MQARRVLKVLFVVLFVIVMLRCLALRQFFLYIPFEYDEIFSAITSDPSVPWKELVRTFLIVDVHPPLYNFFLYIYHHFVPYGPEWIMRFPSVFFGFCSLLAAWFLFPKRLGKTARYVFVILLACNGWLIFYQQYVRVYSFLLFISILWTFLYLRLSVLIRHHRSISWKMWTYYGVLALLLCYSHYFGALAFGIVSLCLFVEMLRKKQEPRTLIWVCLSVFSLYLIWLWPNFLENISQVRFHGNWWANDWYMSDPSFKDMLWAVFPAWLRFLFNGTEGYLVWTFFVALGAYYIYKSKKRIPQGRNLFIMILPWVLAWGIIWILSQKLFLFIERYFIPFVPGIYLALSILVAPLIRRYKLCWLILLIFCFYGMQHVTRYMSWRKTGKLGMYSGPLLAEYMAKNNLSDMLAIAIEGFPDSSTELLVNWYPVRQLGPHVHVQELMHLPAEERNQIIKSNLSRTVWMPNCAPAQLKQLQKIVPYKFTITEHSYGSCYMQFSKYERITESSK